VQYRDYIQKAEAMFTGKGLKELPDFRWERALLCIGNYILPRGRNNSFLVNSSTDQASWKRLLRGSGPKVPESRKMLCELWSRLNGIDNLTEQLDSIIAGGKNIDPWRYAIARTPAVISYCSQRLIRWEDKDEIYLLKATQMNGKHAELYSYCLYMNRLAALDESGFLKPIGILYFDATSTDYFPGIGLYFTYENVHLIFNLEYRSGNYIIFIGCEKVAPVKTIETVLRDDVGFCCNGTSYVKEVTPDLIEDAIMELRNKLANVKNLDSNII
jgi:hypothetical protein